jgi:hypothetical protein
MKFDYFDVFLPIQFGIVGIFFLVIGLRGLLTKRPFLVSNGWLLSMMCVLFVPMGLFSLSLLDDDPRSLVSPLLCVVMLVMMCYQLRGYTGFAVTDASFREALLAVLQRLQLPYEESLSVIRLTSIDADLQVAVQSWMGTGTIKVRQRGHRSVLKKVVNAMNDYFRTSTVSTNMITCVFWVVAGGGMAASAIVISSFFRGI